jgi:amino acid transporter
VVLILLSSVVGSFVAANTETARVVYNTSREGLLARRLARLHPRYRTPARSVVAIVASSLVLAIGTTIFTDPTTASGLLSTLGTLGIIVMYAMVNVALVVHWFREKGRGISRPVFSWLIAPLVGIAILVVPIWYNLQPDQTPPYNLLPLLLPLVLLGGGAYTAYVQLSKPQLLSRAGSLVMGERTPSTGFQAQDDNR